MDIEEELEKINFSRFGTTGESFLQTLLAMRHSLRQKSDRLSFEELDSVVAAKGMNYFEEDDDDGENA